MLLCSVATRAVLWAGHVATDVSVEVSNAAFRVVVPVEHGGPTRTADGTSSRAGIATAPAANGEH